MRTQRPMLPVRSARGSNGGAGRGGAGLEAVIRRPARRLGANREGPAYFSRANSCSAPEYYNRNMRLCKFIILQERAVSE